MRNVPAAEDHQPGAGQVTRSRARLLPGRGSAGRPGRGSDRQQRGRLPGGRRRRPDAMYRTAVEGAPDRLRQVRHLRVWDVARTTVPVHSAFQQGEPPGVLVVFPRATLRTLEVGAVRSRSRFRLFGLIVTAWSGRPRRIRSVRLRREFGRVPEISGPIRPVWCKFQTPV